MLVHPRNLISSVYRLAIPGLIALLILTALIIMSLLTSTNSGSTEVDYFIQNIGGSGAGASDTPCIKGTQFGAVRVGDPVFGMVIRGDTAGTGQGFIRGGLAASSSLTLGSSTASASNIVLTDGVVTFNGDVVVSGSGSDLSVGGNIILANGDAAGKSISGYYNATIASASYPDGADTVLATPGDLTPGWHIYATSAVAGSQAEECVSTLVYYNGTLFTIGGTIQSVAGAGSFGFKVADNRTTMRLHNATGAAQTVTVNIAKLLN